MKEWQRRRGRGDGGSPHSLYTQGELLQRAVRPLLPSQNSQLTRLPPGYTPSPKNQSPPHLCRASGGLSLWGSPQLPVRCPTLPSAAETAEALAGKGSGFRRGRGGERPKPQAAGNPRGHWLSSCLPAPGQEFSAAVTATHTCTLPRTCVHGHTHDPTLTHTHTHTGKWINTMTHTHRPTHNHTGRVHTHTSPPLL